MAIRLVEEYPNRTGAPDAEYPHGIPRNRSAPGAIDGTPFEQAWFRDKEGFMQGLLETAGITPSGSPDTVTDSDYIDALVSVAHGVVEVDVGGSADTTLSIYPSRFAALKLTGGLAADVDLIVPDTERLYWIVDETTGGFSVTVRTAAGTGVVVSDDTSVVRCDGVDVVGALEYATATEAQDLTSLTKVLTPGRLADAFQGGNQSLNAMGYQILPGGLIIQWGNGGNGVGNFPIPFPNNALKIVGSDNLDDIPNASGIGAISNSQYEINTDDTGTINYIVVGF